MFFRSCLVALLLGLQAVWAMPVKVVVGSGEIPALEQWQVVDLCFDAGTAPEHPFEVEFSGTFSGPDGESLTVPGFYNGGSEYVIRFSAPKEGGWSFTTASGIEAMNGTRGTISVSPNTRKNQHGGLVICEDKPQQFFYEDGTECTVLAFEADWLFALDYDHPDDAPKTKHLMKLIAENGMNQVVTTVYSYDVRWDKDPKLAQHPEHEFGGLDSIYPFMGSNKNPDYSSLNVEFFQQFDRVVDAMNEEGITAHLMIYVWNKLVNWPDTESEADNRYFDYIIKRYQAYPNVLWDVSKEALNNPRCTEAYGLERIERIRKRDAYGRLVTVHDGGFCQRNADKVDFISWQVWSATIYNVMNDVYNKYANKPVFNIEHGGYEESPYVVFPGDFSDPEVCYRRNWLIMFAGVYSTYYWQGAAWNVIIYNPFEQPDDFVKPRFDYYRHLRDFFDAYPVSQFKPSPKDNQSAYCMSNGEGTYLFFIPKYHEKLSKYNWKPEGTIQWFNTFTGEYSEVEQSTAPFFTSPWKGEADAVLILKK